MFLVFVLGVGGLSTVLLHKHYCAVVRHYIGVIMETIACSALIESRLVYLKLLAYFPFLITPGTSHTEGGPPGTSRSTPIVCVCCHGSTPILCVCCHGS